MKKSIITIILSLILLMPAAFSFSVELVKTNPAPIVAGEYADITLRFTNNDQISGSQKDVSFKIDETNFILPVSNTNRTIKEVYQGETFTRTFRVYFSEELEQGYINVPVLVNSNQKQSSYEIEVYVEDSKRKPEIYIGQIETIPNELLPDTKDNKIMITIQNLGEKDAELVSAELEILNNDAKAAYSYSLFDSLSSIEGGSQNNFEFTIDIEDNANDKINAKLKLNYRAEKSIGSSYDIYSEEINLEIPLTDAPKLKIVNLEQLDSFETGSSENRIRLTIKNEGTEEAKEVRVRLAPDISYPFSFEQLTEYVTSSIDVNETAQVEFKVEVLNNAVGKNYSTTAILESLVGETRYSKEDDFNIVVKEANKSDTQSIGKILIGLIIIASITIGFITYKNSKKSKK